MFRKTLQDAARGDVQGNLANKFRQRRINHFVSLLNTVEKDPVVILDIGGTDYYWTVLKIECKSELEIILLNPEECTNKNTDFKYVRGDGRDLSQFKDDSIDIVYSNSVIEHAGTREDQKKFADEIRRIAKRYYIQTPNYFFPFEPHFLTPGIQYLPVKTRAFLIRRFNFGWYNKRKNYNDSLKLAGSIRLLKLKELKSLFPGAVIVKEKFLGLTKSFVVYYGFW